MSRSPRREPSESLTLPPVRHHVDYALARRAVLRDLRTGKRARLDVCDAQPELLRAARNLGERLDADCPVCGADGLVLVSYVYGDGLRRANGRCIETPEELAALEATCEEFSRYVVEVCVEVPVFEGVLVGRRMGSVVARCDGRDLAVASARSVPGLDDL